MTDPYKPAPSPLTDPGAGPAAAPLGAPAPIGSPNLVQSEPFKAPGGPVAGHNEFAGENPLDTLGRMLWAKDSGSVLGGVPGLGAVGRWAGEATAVGIGSVTAGAASVLGALPSAGHITDNAGLGTDLNSAVHPLDPKYDPAQSGGAKAALQLFVDLKNENGGGNMARQFLVVGQWMKQNDPTAFKAWEEALGEAQKETFGAKGSETISNFLSKWGTTYADMTPEGITDTMLDTSPELYFGGSGSLGQGLQRDLGWVFNLQRMAERGAAVTSGNVEGFGHTGPVAGQPDLGSRVNAIVWYGQNNPEKLNPVEMAAYEGLTQQGWTAKHAYNFLVDHQQGYSHDALTELGLSFALDPIGVSALGAGLAAQVGEKAYLYANTAESANRAGAIAKAGARAIGTTVESVRANPVLGPIAKIARTMVDPFSALPGSRGQATVDVFGAVGVEGFDRGMGLGAVSSAARRSDGWGMREVFNGAAATSAMNMARKYVAASIVDDLAHTVGTSARRVIDEDLIQHVAKTGTKDAVTRLAAFAMKNREFWISDIGLDALAERIAKVANQSVDDVRGALDTMSRDEQAVWHQNTYSHAWGQFKNAVARILPDEWGDLGKNLDNMVILNPQELDNIAAQELQKAIEGAGSLKKQVSMWNEAASRYEKIDAIGRITTGGKSQMERRLNALDAMIQNGHLHTAATDQEIAGMPARFQQEFLNAWTDSEGNPMWRVGWKPNAEQATGLVYDKAGELVAWYAPSVDNVAQAAEMLTKRAQPLTDILGRVVKGVPGVGVAKDSIDVAVQTALDRVSGDRIITGMEQDFRRSMRNAGYSDKTAKNVFRLSRDAAQDHGFSLAGMSPDEFWKASKSELKGLVDERVAKREVFSMLAKSAGGDMRLLGLSSWTTQRIRSGLIARGLDPNNYLGAVTVKLYNALRYSLNPTFFLQAEFDAPWFNMYRGVMPVGGKAPKAGSALWEMERITKAMGHTGLSRDLQMDFTERVATIGWQEAVRDGLDVMPGVKGGFSRFKQWSGRMILNNELAYMNSKIGDVVFDAMDHVRGIIDDKIANATTDAERAMWQDARFDQVPMFDWLHDDFVQRMGRVPTQEELGRDYLAQMIDDSKMEVRTKEGLLDYQRVNSKGEYHKPSDIGDIRPLDLEYGVQSLHLPNVHTLADLRTALGDGSVMMGDVKDIMLREGFHRDAVKRFTAAVKFNWRSYFDGMRQELGMSRYEMQGIEDYITRAAKQAGMTNVDYLTQVMPLTSEKAIAKAARVAKPPEGFSAVSSDQFHAAVVNAAGTVKSNGRKVSETLYTYSPEEYAQMRTFLSEDGLTGYAIKPDGDLVSVFNVGERGRIEKIVPTFKAQGATKLDAFDESGRLPDLYRKGGFEVTSRDPWNPQYAPEGWQGGTPDVVYMQVPDRPMAAVDDHLKFVLDSFRAIEKGGDVGLDDITRLVTSHLQPSMKARLLNHFADSLDAQIAALEAAGPSAALRDLRELKINFADGAWGPEADQMYRDLVVARAGGSGGEVVSHAPFEWPSGQQGRAALPKVFKHEDGYVYRIESTDVAGSSWPGGGKDGTGVSIEPDLQYAKDENHALYRAKVDPANLLTGRNGAGSKDRLLVNDVPADQIEFLGADGQWRPAPTLIPDAEVERGARYFAQYLQSINPKVIAGETLKAIVDNIPVEGASAHDFTQALLASTIRQNFRLAEQDAIRLAHIQPNRSVLERSLNHPFFAMYPSSYFWGKVIPETFKFIATEPFGMKTTLGTYAFLKTQQSVALQSQYDPRMADLWKSLGKSATISLLSYLSPSMPWEDMSSNLPPWVRGLAKGDDFNAILGKELDTVSPERWVSHFTDAAGEVGDVGSGIIKGLTAPQQSDLQNITQPVGQPGSSVPAGPNPFNLPGQPAPYAAPTGPVKATGLAPVLSQEMADLDKVLSGR